MSSSFRSYDAPWRSFDCLRAASAPRCWRSSLSACDSGSTSTAPPSTPIRRSRRFPGATNPPSSFRTTAPRSRPCSPTGRKVKGQLNFTPYLPPTLPAGSCLVLAGGTIHDPIYGARLSITYDLPNSVPVSFSEAPKRANLSETLQCQASTTDATTSICIGAIANTTVTIAARQVQSDVQTLFKSLQPNVDWVPTITATPPRRLHNARHRTPNATATPSK